MPVAWVTGEPMRFGVPGVIHGRMCTSSASSVRWLCITPLGSLVVPDVYASTHTSSGSAARDPVAGASASTMIPSDARGRACGCDGRRRPHHDVHAEVGSSSGSGAVDDVEVVDVAVSVGGDVGAGPALGEDEPHLLVAVDVHDRHEDVATHRQPVERDDGLAPVRELEGDDVTRFETRPRASAATSRSASERISA